jgi:hypothetical protein
MKKSPYKGFFYIYFVFFRSRNLLIPNLLELFSFKLQENGQLKFLKNPHL